MATLAPIVLFVYNRPEHTKRTVESLLNNTFANSSMLYIFSDGTKSEKDSRKITEVRDYIKKIEGFKRIEIIYREKNFGLANSIVSGINEILNEFEKVIALEDDMVFSPYFLKFINSLLDFYTEDKRIFSVTGYTFPITIPDHYANHLYLSPRASSWGWGTWKDRWMKVDWKVKDFDKFITDISKIKSFNEGGDDLTRMLKNSISGKIDSWSIIWSYAHFVNNAYCVYPTKSRVRNIGADKSGVHTSKTTKYDVPLEFNDTKLEGIKDIQPDEVILKNFRKFFKKIFLFSAVSKLKY